MRATKDVVVHGVCADGSRGGIADPLAGTTPASDRPSLGTLLQNQLLADTARREPRLYLLFARSQQHAGRPYAERVSTAVCLKQQAQVLVSWFVDPSRQCGATQLALVFRTIDLLLMLGDHPTDDAAPVRAVAS